MSRLARLVSGLRTWAGAWRAARGGYRTPAYCQMCSLTEGTGHMRWCAYAQPVTHAAPHDTDDALTEEYRIAEALRLGEMFRRDAEDWGRWAA